MDENDPVVLAESKITAQGQISVPAEVRRKLGLGPGSVLEWEENDGEIIVRRAGRFSSQDVHRRVFSTAPKPKDGAALKEGIRDRMRKRHAKR